MVVDVKDIKELLAQLAKKSISREKAQEQAVVFRETYDSGSLEFYPLEYETKIWDAVQYIELFAEKIDINTYLYSDNDLLNYIKENDWDI